MSSSSCHRQGSGFWLRRIRGLLWFRMRGGARFPWLGPFEQVRPGFLVLDVKDVTCALNEHSIVDVGGSLYRIILASLC